MLDVHVGCLADRSSPARLQAQNATVAIMVLASKGSRVDAVSALQAGAADFMVSVQPLTEVAGQSGRLLGERIAD